MKLRRMNNQHRSKIQLIKLPQRKRILFRNNPTRTLQLRNLPKKLNHQLSQSHLFRQNHQLNNKLKRKHQSKLMNNQLRRNRSKRHLLNLNLQRRRLRLNQQRRRLLRRSRNLKLHRKLRRIKIHQLKLRRIRKRSHLKRLHPKRLLLKSPHLKSQAHQPLNLKHLLRLKLLLPKRQRKRPQPKLTLLQRLPKRRLMNESEILLTSL
jgi:hypothetical protein